jgi:hypothetical protein
MVPAAFGHGRSPHSALSQIACLSLKRGWVVKHSQKDLLLQKREGRELVKSEPGYKNFKSFRSLSTFEGDLVSSGTF